LPIIGVLSGDESKSLAARLNDASRDRIVIVVTAPSGSAEPLIDVERIDHEVGDFASVFVMPTGDPSWEFAAAMTPGTHVYGGAGRVYPAGLDWLADLGRSPLRFGSTVQEAARATTRLIHDAFSAAARAGYGSASPVGRSSLATAVVQGTPTDTEAIVRMADGRYAAIKSAKILPGVPASRIFTRGMVVEGEHFAETGLFDVGAHMPPAAPRLEELQVDDVLPVFVTSVDFSSCSVDVLPGSSVTLLRERVTGSEDDDLCDLLSADEVVLARVGFATDGTLTLSMIGVDEGDLTRPALSVWPGGPAWLAWPVLEPELDDDLGGLDRGSPERAVEALAASAVTLSFAHPAMPVARQATPLDLRPGASRPTPSNRDAGAPLRGGLSAVQTMSLSLDAARAGLAAHEKRANDAEERIRLMDAELLRFEAEASELRRRSERQDDELSRLKTRHRTTLNRERTGVASASGVVFIDPEEEFRWQVYSAWVHRIPAGEKAARPLGDYSIGPEFLDSLGIIEGISVAKVAGVVVEVLTGLAESNASRRMHPLRRGAGGEESIVRRGGATCWRVALQTSTPAARRLHFWRSASGIELSRVVLHDDVRP
jgi:hypothetical protein